ncbi:MAG: MerR family transcriptional regulator [Crocinitomicaceae bacterium]
MKEEIYSIKDLENFTHIKAHTIRIWEQRYNLLSPKRTDSNIRYYDKEDLKKILNVNMLYTNGMKISKIAALSEEEIVDKCKDILNREDNLASKEVENYILKITDFDHDKLRILLEESFSNHGAHKFYGSVIAPLLTRMGKLWQVNTLEIVHEHFLSSLLREFLISKTHETKNKRNGKKVVCFLGEDELHEFSMLFYLMILNDKGYECIYLGQNLPLDELELFKLKVNPDFYLTSFVGQISEKNFVRQIDKLRNLTKGKKLIISGNEALKHKELIGQGIELITSEEDLNRIFV